MAWARVSPQTDEFGDHWVVVGRDLKAGIHARIHAHAGTSGNQAVADAPRGGDEIIERVLRVHAAFDGVPFEFHIVLCVAELASACDA